MNQQRQVSQGFLYWLLLHLYSLPCGVERVEGECGPWIHLLLLFYERGEKYCQYF
jgi:hypothetical protein